MKREFLQSIQVEGKALPKEVIDAIMAENGRDIEKAKGAYADYESLQMEKQALEAEFENVRQSHQKELLDLKFQHLLKASIQSQKGRNEKAITALLDIPALMAGEDMEGAVEGALAGLREEHPYLFEATTFPPPYARDAGGASSLQEEPVTLAGALKERFYLGRK